LKPALYIALKGYSGHLTSHRPLTDSDLMVVTSEKGSQCYGRDVAHGNPTHMREEDVVAKFATLENARAAMELAKNAHLAYVAVIERAKGELRTLETTQRNAVKTAISGLVMK
jgi:hypothetical protein